MPVAPRLPPTFVAPVLLLAALASPSLAQTGGADPAVIERIRREGLERSQVMEHVIWLADVHGPRLTGSPGMEEAGEWALGRLEEWGLADVRRKRFAFGRGWSLERFGAHMLEPRVQPIIGMPMSWTRGTDGPVVAEVALAPILAEEDFDRYRGTLRDKIVLPQPARDVPLLDGRVVLLMTEDEVHEARTVDPRAAPRPPAAPPAGPSPPPPPPAPWPRASRSSRPRRTSGFRGGSSPEPPGRGPSGRCTGR